MDEAVVRALVRWPNVPDCVGWLMLTRRGEWRIGAQRERIAHAGLNDFIGRNYLADTRGAWYFQNGPQRVWVRLEYTPLVYRLVEPTGPTLLAHTGAGVGSVRAAALDQDGSLVLLTELGAGVVDDRDLTSLAARIVDSNGNPVEDELLDPQTSLWLDLGVNCLRLDRISSADAAQRYGFISDPQGG